MKETSDDNEYARYLATYLSQNMHEFVFTSFDRNASHSAEEYREYSYISEECLYDLICRFDKELP